MGSYFTDAGVFLADTLLTLYLLAVLLRFLLQVVRADFYNPIAHFLVVATNPPLKPLRRVIPGLYGIDLASVVLLVLVELVYQLVLGSLLGQALAPGALLVRGVFHLLNLVLNVYLFSILIVVILSWVSPYQNALSQLLARLTNPLLRPARRWLPPLGGLDLSPMLVMIAIVLVQMALPYLQRAASDLLF
jgi:YggT family protein